MPADLTVPRHRFKVRVTWPAGDTVIKVRCRGNQHAAEAALVTLRLPANAPPTPDPHNPLRYRAAMLDGSPVEIEIIA